MSRGSRGYLSIHFLPIAPSMFTAISVLLPFPLRYCSYAYVRGDSSRKAIKAQFLRTEHLFANDPWSPVSLSYYIRYTSKALMSYGEITDGISNFTNPLYLYHLIYALTRKALVFYNNRDDVCVFTPYGKMVYARNID